MTKTKKTNKKHFKTSKVSKKKASPKTKRRKIQKKKYMSHNKSVKHIKNYINIDNTGSTEVVYSEGKNTPKKTIFKWDGNYDGKNANIHMKLDVDGKKTKSDLKLSNNDLMKILGVNVVTKPVDERLELLDENVSNIYSESTPSSIMILSQEPQMMPSSNVPVFMDEMPMDMNNSSNKKRKLSK